jgi:hypothetical protein
VPKKPKTVRGEIVRMNRGDLEIDVRDLPTEELIRHVRELEAELHVKQLELANLQISETRLSLLSQQRSLMVEKYVREIAALDAVTAGGLKSVQPSQGDDPELVAEAWRIYVHMQRGGGSRFG